MKELPYTCAICQWHGCLEPSHPLRDACCPNCGTLLEAPSWTQTWGLPLLLMGLAVIAVAFCAFMR